MTAKDNSDRELASLLAASGEQRSMDPDTVAMLARPESTMFQLVLRRFRRHKLAVASAIVLGLLIGVCFVVPLFVDEDAANWMNHDAKREPPSLRFPFGTDDVGRDMLLRAIYGGRISLGLGIVAALIAVTIGTAVGGIAGFSSPGPVDSILMRFTETLLSIPTLFILIVLARIVGNSVTMIAIVIGGLSWMGVSRLVRAEILSLKEQDFILAAGALGVPSRRILVFHLLPNVVAPIVVAATLGVGMAIIWEASLSFLGLGVQPPTATWGSMLHRAQRFLVDAPWIAIFPGLLILITVLCVNFVGDGLRDALDPYSPR
jgi:peptide/nickel transport system permease protein